MAEEQDKKETEAEESLEPGTEGTPAIMKAEVTGPVEAGKAETAKEELAALAQVSATNEDPREGMEPVAISEISSDDRLLSALMWVSMVLLQLPLLSGALLLIEPSKSRPFQRHHAVISIIFWVAALIYEGVALIVYTLFSIISLGCLAICGWVILLVPHLLALYYALKAFNGQEVEVPFITQFAKRQGWL